MIYIHMGCDRYKKRKSIYKKIYSSKSFVTVLTPEQSTWQKEREFIDILNIDGLFHVQIMSFSRLLNRVSKEIFQIENTITDIGKSLLYSSIFEEEKDNLKVFAKTVKKEGFQKEIDDLFSLFEREMISPENIIKLAEQQKDENTKLKFLDIYTLYQKYKERTKEFYFDDEASLELFEKEANNYNIVSKDAVWIIGYKLFSKRDLRIIKKIYSLTNEIHIELPFEDKYDRLSNRTLGLIKENIGDVKILNYGSDDENYNFSKSLESFQEQKFNIDLSIFPANSIYDEVEFIALDILRKTREDKCLNLSDFRIISTDLENYKSIFFNVFGSLSIPIFCDERKKINTIPIIKGFISLINCFIKGFTYNNVFSFLKSYITKKDYSKLDIFENYCYENGVKFEKEIDDIEIEGFRKKFLGNILKYREKLKGKNTSSNFSIFILDMLKKLEFDKNILFDIDYYYENGANEEASILDEAWTSLFELISQISIIKDDQISFKDYTRLLISSISDITVGILPPSKENIELSKLHRTVHRSCRYLYFCGMNDSLIPKEYDEDILLKESEKKEINELGFPLPSENDIKKLIDIYDFRTAITGAENIIFSYSYRNMTGEEQKPSIYIERAIKNTNSYINDSDYLVEYHKEDKMVAKKYLIDSLNQNRDIIIDNITQYEAEEIHKNIDSKIDLKNLRIKDKKLKLSVSRFENYKRCPFSYYIKHLIKARKRKQFKVEAVDIGSLYHKIVEEAIKEYTNNKLMKKDISSYIESSLEEIIKEKEYRVFFETKANQYLLKRAKEVLLYAINILIEHLENTDYKASFFEKRFYKREENYEITGVIDRIDIKDDKFVIIDYKSGNKKCDLNRIYQGVDIQLVVYMDAFKDESNYNQMAFFYFHLNDPILSEDITEGRRMELKFEGYFIGDKDMALSYDKRADDNTLSSLNLRFTNKGEIYSNSKALSYLQSSNLIRKVKEDINRYAVNIKNGYINIEPIKIENYTACDYCDYKAICRFVKGDKGMDFVEIEKLDISQIKEKLNEN